MRSRRAPTTPSASASPNAWQVGALRARPPCKRRAAASANKGVSGALSRGLSVRNPERKVVAGRHRRQRGDPQRANPAGAYHAHEAAAAMSASPAAALDLAAAWRWGLKLAQPERRIVQVIGDGGFHFSSPDSVYAVAQQYRIPILTVVLDNGGWQAVKSAVQRVYPKGRRRRDRSVSVAADLGPSGRAAGFLRRGNGLRRAWRMRHASRMISRQRSIAAWPRWTTAGPPCCMFTITRL